jgi:hypothetical protein|tara:strand:- start:169 stop:1956 length:1788 start_codon:yes stop_codon:yes gene_type:complete
MNYENYFVEVAVGDVSSRNVVIPYHKLSEIVNKNIGKEIYRSMFLYQKSIVNHIEDTGSIKGYEGIQALDKIVFDVDKGTKSNEDLKKQTHKLMRKLVDLDCHPKYINIWFSGRGFHVVIPNLYGFKPSINLAREVKATIARDFGNKTDLIYDSKRLIRLPFSLNKKTNLYKTYLTHTQFLKFSYDEIVEYCEEVRFDMPEAVNGVKTIWEPMKHSKKEVKQERIVLQDATYQTNADVTCGQHIYNKGAAVENRHLTLLRLVSIWRRKGFTQEQCIVLGKNWIETYPDNFNESEIKRIVIDTFSRPYEFNCQDEILEAHCDSKCKYFKSKDYGSNIKLKNVDEIIETYKQYIEDAKYNNTFNFKDLVNIKEDYIFTAGDLVILGGNTKIGKTAFVQWIVSQVPDVKTAFLSLEVGENLINRRFFQCIIGLHKDNFKEWNQEYDQYLKEGMNHISVTDESPDIRDYHKIIETYNPKMLVIDTIDTIPVKYYQEEYERQNFVIKELKSLANKYKIIIFGISHISKFAAQQLENGERLGIHSFKGNSVIEQKADKVIGFEQQSDNEKIRIISSLGTRDESPFEVRMLFNYETFSFEQL